MKRLLTPALNMPGLIAAIAAIYAIVQAAANTAGHGSVLTAPVIVAAIGAGLAAYTRTQVTPVADPRDGNSKPLTPELLDLRYQPSVPSPSGTTTTPAGSTR